MCVSLVHYGKHIITDMINFSNPGKVEMYGHSRGVLQYILFSSNLPMAMAFAFLIAIVAYCI